MRTSAQNREDSRGIVKRCQQQKILFIFIVLGAVLGIVLLVVFTIGGQETCNTATCLMLLEKLLKVQNSTIDPCEDFFSYACGDWEANHIQGMNMSLMNVFDVLLEENQLIVRKLLEERHHGFNSSAKEKALRFYTSCMNTKQIEAQGAQPLKDLINEIGGWNITGSWKVTDFNQTLQILMKRFNTFPFFKAYVGPSPSDPSNNIIQIDHPEFDLPPDNDFKKSPAYPEVLRSYLSYLMKLGHLMGGDPALTNIYVSESISFISNLQMLITPLKIRQEKKMLFYSTTIGELQQNAPSIDWLSCLQETFQPVPLNMSQSIVVHDMDYLINMSRLIKEWQSKRDVLQIYMILCLVRNLSPALDGKFEEAYQELKEKLNRKTAKMVKTERWRTCLSETSTFFGPVLGEMVVQEIFPTKAKDLAKQMFSEIQEAIHSHLDQVEWMGTQSREAAKGKIYNLHVEIGYPGRSIHKSEVDDEYQELDIYEDNFFHNVVVCLGSVQKRLLLKLINPHLQDSWEVAPWSVHSYYSLRRHAVVFPAGMFRSPFFHTEFPSAVNFGAMGFFMAHELLHSFHDYVMPKNCSDCNMKPLTKEIDCLVKQYESYSLKGHSINGSFTLQENAADTGGLNIAFQAYKNWLARHRWVKELPELRFSHYQLFFISFARAMCGQQTFEELETLRRDLHSPPPLRVLGSLSNCQEFSRHFSCPRGSPMNPVQKCHIW